jgi:catechol 2,3-dioxygenase-like lactoylglutathione lyase family enzyme
MRNNDKLNHSTRMKIVEFAFVVYPATDLPRSRAFYEGVLGLTSTTRFENADQFWIEYEIGPHTLGIGNEPFLKASGDGPHVVLEADDFDEAIEHLTRQNVRFALEPSVMPPGCRAAIIMDPDGNKLGIHKRKA